MPWPAAGELGKKGYEILWYTRCQNRKEPLLCWNLTEEEAEERLRFFGSLPYYTKNKNRGRRGNPQNGRNRGMLFVCHRISGAEVFRKIPLGQKRNGKKERLRSGYWPGRNIQRQRLTGISREHLRKDSDSLGLRKAVYM